MLVCPIDGNIAQLVVEMYSFRLYNPNPHSQMIPIAFASSAYSFLSESGFKDIQDKDISAIFNIQHLFSHKFVVILEIHE
jgi:hypothetical protein